MLEWGIIGMYLEVIVWGIIGILLLNLAGKINDKLILRRFKNRKELVDDQNVGTGAVVAGGYLGSAIIIRSVLVGESMGWGWDLLLVIGYFLLGQVFFFLFSALYQVMTKYDLHAEIEADNPAAGVAFGMHLVSMGILLAKPLSDSFSIVYFIAWLVIGSSMMAVTRYVLDRLIVPSESLDKEIHEDRNWGIAFLEGSFSIVGVVLLAAIF